MTRTAGELARALMLSPLNAAEIEVRAALNDQIIKIVRRRRLTHAQVAKAAQTSRSRVTAILNRNTHQVSTDLLLRILAALGYRAKLTMHRVPRAARATHARASCIIPRYGNMSGRRQATHRTFRPPTRSSRSGLRRDAAPNRFRQPAVPRAGGWDTDDDAHCFGRVKE